MTESASGGHPPKMGMMGRWSCVRWSRIASVIWPALVVGCGEPSPRRDAEGGLPAWLTACDDDADCDADARCLGGVCTLACGASKLDLCGGLNEDAACDTLLGACVVPCVVSMACQVLGPGYQCKEGRCRAP